MDIENEYEGKVVLVTGGAGCIGTNLSRKLAELNAERVIILDDLSSAYEWNIPRPKNIVFVKGSVLDDEMVKRVFKEKPDCVFHLAAHFANQNSVGNPMVEIILSLLMMRLRGIIWMRFVKRLVRSWSIYRRFVLRIPVLKVSIKKRERREKSLKSIEGIFSQMNLR